jgi:hypothetical protein
VTVPPHHCAFCGGEVAEEQVVIDPMLDEEGNVVSLLAYHPTCIELLDASPFLETEAATG